MSVLMLHSMNMKRNIIVVFIVIIIGLCIYQLANVAQEKVVIGAIIPQTGFGAYWGDPVTKGITLAERDLQEVYGKDSISVVIEDSQSSPTTGATVANKLISINKANTLYTEFSGVSSAVSAIAKSAGVPLVYSTFNQKIAEDNKLSIKTFVSYETTCEQFSKHLNDSTKKVLILSVIGDAAPYCVRGLEKHLPSENVKSIEGITGTDFRTILLQNKEFNPDYIIPIMYEDGAFALIKQKHELGLKTSFFCYKQDCITDKLLQELPKAATENIMFFQMPIAQSFIDRISKEYPGMSSDDIQGAANAYQSIMFIGSALMQCDAVSSCAVEKLSNKKSLEHAAYTNAYFKDRVLYSDIRIGVIRDGEVNIVQ